VSSVPSRIFQELTYVGRNLKVEGGKSALVFTASLNVSVSKTKINKFPTGVRSYRPNLEHFLD
jgi:hypothetical protein